MDNIQDISLPTIAHNLFAAAQGASEEITILLAGENLIDRSSNLPDEAIPFINLVGDVFGEGVQGAIVNANIRLLYQSIRMGGAYCRGEQELGHEELINILKVAIEGLQGGFVRGAAIKVIQSLAGSNLVAALGFTVCTEAIPVMLKVMMNELTVEQAIAEVGPKVVTSGVITTIVLLFPQIGTVMLSVSVLQAIWEEMSPEWKENLQQTFNAAISSPRYRTASD